MIALAIFFGFLLASVEIGSGMGKIAESIRILAYNLNPENQKNGK